MAVGLLGVVAIAVGWKWEAGVPTLRLPSGIAVGPGTCFVLQRGREADMAGQPPLDLDLDLEMREVLHLDF